MNRKNNFLIAISEKNNHPELNVNPDLPGHYNMVIGNLSISLRYSKNILFAKSNDENVIILLSGYIYHDDLHEGMSNEKYLLDLYSEYERNFVRYLNGSFCLFFAQKDSGDVYLATDRLNTRKIYKYEKGKNLQFSTDINYLPLNECELSYAGAACYMINSIMLSDLTIFEHIKKLERATLNKVVDFKVNSQNYWDYNFTYEYKNRPVNELAEELHQLYLKSLNKIIKGKKDIYISLSGGYDSRGVAVMLKNFAVKNSAVTCLSHNFREDNKDTDSDIAARTAEKLGYRFRLLSSYNGEPFQTLKNNALLGHATAGFCTELDAWDVINKELEKTENSILLVGDMYDGTYMDFHGNVKRSLEKARICEPSFLNVFSNYFGPETLKNLYESWDKEYKKILKKVSVYKNMVDLLDYLYMDQLIPNLYGIERECFHMPFIETASPYYDNEVLDFVQKITPELRDRKKLHKKTLETYYPEIFNIPFPSKGWGSEPEWINEIRLFSNVFINNINNSKSKLDDLISPDRIIDSILSLNEAKNNENRGRTILRSIHKTIKKVIPSYHKIFEILPGGEEITRKAGKYIHSRITHHPLIKILILRLYLTRN